MRRALLGIVLLGLSAGCAPPPPVAVLRAPQGAMMDRRAAAAPNLLLGPSKEHVRIAQMLTWRSDWPSVAVGHRFDESSTYTEVVYDDQFFHDTLGGFYFRVGQEVRSGSVVR